MTEKLYNHDAYLKSATAVVEEISGNYVVLDRTIFAPDSGGQPCDLGTIGGFSVLSVTEKNGTVLHEVSEADASKLAAGSEQLLRLDWARRFDHMQNHIGEHIMSGLFKSEYGLDNRGFHLGDDIGTYDIDSKNVTQEMIDNIELLANDVVYRALPVQITLIDSAEEAASLPLRKELKVDEDITVVTIPGVDCVACCCPHPADTSQVGVIKIVRTENYKGMTRIYFKCGGRALRDYQQKHKVVSLLAEKYSADEFTLPEKVETAEKKNDAVRRDLNRMKDRFAEITAEGILASAGAVAVSELENADLDELRRVAKKLTAATEKPVILSSASDLCVLLTYAGKKQLKFGQIVKEFAVGAGGKGGGRDDQAQVVFEDAGLMRNFVKIAEIEAMNK